MSEQEEVLVLDEENESYGYAIYNTHQGCFIPVGEFKEEVLSYHGEENLVQYESDVKRAFIGAILRNALDRHSHLRVVSVSLENDLDSEVAGLGDKVLDNMAEFEDMDLERVFDEVIE